MWWEEARARRIAKVEDGNIHRRGSSQAAYPVRIWDRRPGRKFALISRELSLPMHRQFSIHASSFSLGV